MFLRAHVSSRVRKGIGSQLTTPNCLDDDEESHWVRLHPHNIEPLISLFEQFLPRTRRSLPCREQSHHSQISRRTHLRNRPRQIRHPFLTSLLAHIIDEQYPRTGLHCRRQTLKDLHRLLVRPVVQDQLEHVYIGLDGLGLEEAVGGERDAGGEV